MPRVLWGFGAQQKLRNGRGTVMIALAEDVAVDEQAVCERKCLALREDRSAHNLTSQIVHLASGAVAARRAGEEGRHFEWVTRRNVIMTYRS